VMEARAKEDVVMMLEGGQIARILYQKPNIRQSLSNYFSRELIMENGASFKVLLDRCKRSCRVVPAVMCFGNVDVSGTAFGLPHVGTPMPREQINPFKNWCMASRVCQSAVPPGTWLGAMS
jgi:hypothetical protein